MESNPTQRKVKRRQCRIRYEINLENGCKDAIPKTKQAED